jgi:hypothetical protein
LALTSRYWQEWDSHLIPLMLRARMMLTEAQ